MRLSEREREFFMPQGEEDATICACEFVSMKLKVIFQQGVNHSRTFKEASFAISKVKTNQLISSSNCLIIITFHSS